MFKWLISLFTSKPAEPPPQVPDRVYRFGASKTTKVKPTGAAQTTLFPRPEPTPTSSSVEVVKPTTEADRYQWLDYSKPYADSSVQQSSPSLAQQTSHEQDNPYHNLSGSVYACSGELYPVAKTGQSGMFITTTKAITGKVTQVARAGWGYISTGLWSVGR